MRNLHGPSSSRQQESSNAPLSNAVGFSPSQVPNLAHSPAASLPAPEAYGLFTPAESHITYSPGSVPALPNDEGTHSHAEQSTYIPRCDPSTIFPCPGEPSSIQAEEYFSRFRTHMLRFFPVFHLPDTTTSGQLREERPFLWLCVMCVACSSTSQQLALGDSVRQIISREIVYKGEKNIDLLLGLLIFLAWYVAKNYSACSAICAQPMC